MDFSYPPVPPPGVRLTTWLKVSEEGAGVPNSPSPSLLTFTNPCFLISAPGQTLPPFSRSLNWERRGSSWSCGARGGLQLRLRTAHSVPTSHFSLPEPADRCEAGPPLLALVRAHPPGLRLRRRTGKRCPVQSRRLRAAGSGASRPEGEKQGRWRLWWRM